MFELLNTKVQNPIVIPEWQDSRIFHLVQGYLNKHTGYSLEGIEDFTLKRPSYMPVLESRNSCNAGPTIEEFAEEFGKEALKKANALASNYDSQLILLFGKRGLGGQFPVRASFYKYNQFE